MIRSICGENDDKNNRPSRCICGEKDDPDKSAARHIEAEELVVGGDGDEVFDQPVDSSSALIGGRSSHIEADTDDEAYSGRLSYRNVCGESAHRVKSLSERPVDRMPSWLQAEEAQAPGAAGVAALRAMLGTPAQTQPPGSPLSSEAPSRSFSLINEQDPQDVQLRLDRLPSSSQASVYEGPRKDGKPEGEGTETWADGVRYDGQFRSGCRDGSGRLSWPSGSSYEGDFRTGVIRGDGTFRWPDGSTYVGQWENGRMNKKGLFTWTDGRSYDGEYRDDRKEGHGIFRWPDGRRFEGQWKQGRSHGSGRYTAAGGKTRCGEWEEGRRVRWTSED